MTFRHNYAMIITRMFTNVNKVSFGCELYDALQFSDLITTGFNNTC